MAGLWEVYAHGIVDGDKEGRIYGFGCESYLCQIRVRSVGGLSNGEVMMGIGWLWIVQWGKVGDFGWVREWWVNGRDFSK